MTGSVVFLDSHRRKPEPTVTERSCCCHSDYVCFPHRIDEAARILREDMAATRAEGRVSMGRYFGTCEAVLPLLEAIVAETLPDERGVQ